MDTTHVVPGDLNNLKLRSKLHQNAGRHIGYLSDHLGTGEHRGRDHTTFCIEVRAEARKAEPFDSIVVDSDVRDIEKSVDRETDLVRLSHFAVVIKVHVGHLIRVKRSRGKKVSVRVLGI